MILQTGPGDNKGKNPKDNKNNRLRPFPKPNLERSVPIRIGNSNFVIRTIWTFIMLLAFVAIILAGHFYCAFFVFLMDIGMVKEILSLKRNKEKENHVPFSMVLNWYFFVVASFYFYGKVFANKLTRVILINKVLYVKKKLMFM